MRFLLFVLSYAVNIMIIIELRRTKHFVLNVLVKQPNPCHAKPRRYAFASNANTDCFCRSLIRTFSVCHIG